MLLADGTPAANVQAPGYKLESSGLRPWLPLILAATAYLNLLKETARLLIDSDIYWHVTVGQWIIDHHAVPHVDPFSFTMPGQHWITSAWLSEVVYFGAYKIAGWAGPLVLAAFAIALAFFLLTHLLLKRLPNIPVMILVGAGIALAAPHMLARPHVLVFPILVLWANALVSAAEERRAPTLRHLVLITLWANLHGSFTFGLALIAPFAVEAIWMADAPSRKALLLSWLRFAGLALVAACITPYGPELLLVTFRLLGIGSILSTISEWQPQDFGTWSAFEVCLLAAIAYALFSGFRLPLLRIVMVLAVLHETLTHRRYVDVVALVVPFFVAGPLAEHLSYVPKPSEPKLTTFQRRGFIAAGLALVVLTGTVMARASFTPPLTPLNAVEKIKELGAKRIFNEYYFGGYLIYKGIPTFVDSRAEFYGAPFLTRYHNAITLLNIPDLIALLDEYQIDATLLFPSNPTIGLFDRLEGWERVYADDTAVVHHRRGKAVSPGVR